MPADAGRLFRLFSVAFGPAPLHSALGGLITRRFMTTQTDTVEQSEAEKSSSGKTTALDWAVFGCLAAGGVGIIKALGMDSPSDVCCAYLARWRHSVWSFTFTCVSDEDFEPMRSWCAC